MAAVRLTHTLALGKEKIAEARVIADKAIGEVYKHQNEFLRSTGNFENLANVTEDHLPNANMVRNTDRAIREDYEMLITRTSTTLFAHAESILKLGIFAQMDPEKMVLEDTPQGKRTYMLLHSLDTGIDIYTGGSLVEEAVMAMDLEKMGLAIRNKEGGNLFSLSNLGRAVAIKLHPPHHLEHVTRAWRR
jgi:hypothetical protein